ncbi:hypothetical protein PsorP6_010859 [Peronosclerospora sorghi]|uniref:Uncharacterized protein n=1 Tax=Peronosclerospora sorghi TaxID=230839 RepID=A0ACC0VWJ3_9STRA|nr:hypothetical protein PsorP6_010859 [Peronosclerospora sorghi]
MKSEMKEKASSSAIALDQLDMYCHIGTPRHLGGADTAKLPSTHVFGITTQNSDSTWGIYSTCR